MDQPISRNAAKTRAKLIKAAYEQIHKNGFQGMRVDQVLKQTQLQKGAFYHHFRSKTDLGYAVVDEEIREMLETVWLKPISEIRNPITDIPKILETLMQRMPAMMKEHGCPLNNLAQEMSVLDGEFQKKINASFNLWINTLSTKFEEAKKQNYIDRKVDCASVSRFIIATIEGCISIAKVEQSNDQFIACQTQIGLYLQSLAS